MDNRRYYADKLKLTSCISLFVALEYKPEYLEFIKCDEATILKEERRSMKV
jgi:hypothetical protein